MSLKTTDQNDTFYRLLNMSKNDDFGLELYVIFHKNEHFFDDFWVKFS